MVSSRAGGPDQIIAYENTQANLTRIATKGGDATDMEKWKAIITK
jgi:hypothetical protein